MRLLLLSTPDRWLVSLQTARFTTRRFGFWRKPSTDCVQYLIRCGWFYISAVSRTTEGVK